MRALAWLTVVVSAGALVLGSTAASAPAPALDPPVLLQPAAGKVFPAKTRIGFTVRTHPGDVYLWLYVSRSPTVVDPCGTIKHEVSIWDFEPTPDVSVYEAKPSYYAYDAFWMNTPGTYYWQAYRIEHGGGADGCVESEVRSFTIKAGGSPSPPPPPPSPSPEPPATPDPKPVSQARLAGDFDVNTRITAVSGVGNARPGARDSGTWRFTPTCPAGACNSRLRIEFGRLLQTEHVARITLKKAGDVYKGDARTPLLECNFKNVWGTMTVRLQVTKGQWIDGRWRAARVTGSYDYLAPETTSGIYRCPAAKIRAAVKGSLDT